MVWGVRGLVIAAVVAAHWCWGARAPAQLLTEKQSCGVVVVDPPTVSVGSQIIGILVQSGSQVPLLEQLDDEDLHDLFALALFGSFEASSTHLWQLPTGLGQAPLRLVFVEALLKGTIPSQLGLLDLDILRIAGCHALEGSIPSQLGSMASTANLRLSHSPLTGTIPSQLGNLADLASLELDNTNLAGTLPSQLGRLGKLTLLDVGSTRVHGTIPVQFGNLRSLDKMILEHSQLGGPLPLEVATLPLAEVSFSRVAFTEIPDQQLFPNAVVVRLDLTPLRSWPSVGSTELASLSLDDCGVGGVIPSQLGLHTSLESLRARWNGLTGSVPSQLGLLTGLRVLVLEHNELSSSIPTQLAKLTVLTDLYIPENMLSGPIASQFGAWSSLVSLGVQDNLLSGTIPSQLGLWQRLSHLDLSKNALFGTVPSQLGLLTRLVHIGLADNALTGTLPQQLLSLGGLTFASVARNNLQGGVHNQDNARAVWLDDCTDSGLDEHDCAYTCPDCPHGAVALVACDWKGRKQWCVHGAVVGIVSAAIVVGWLSLYWVLRDARERRLRVVLLALRAVFSTVELVLDMLFTASSSGTVFILAVTFLAVLGLCKLGLGLSTMRPFQTSLPRFLTTLVCACSVAHVVVLKDILRFQSRKPATRFTAVYVSIGLTESLGAGTLQLMTILKGNTSNVVVAAFACSALSFCSLAALSVVLLLWRGYATHALSKERTEHSLEMQDAKGPGLAGPAREQPSEQHTKGGQGPKRWLAAVSICCLCAVAAWPRVDGPADVANVVAVNMRARQSATPLAARHGVPDRALVAAPKQTTPICQVGVAQSIEGAYVCVLGELIAVVDSLGSSESLDLEAVMPDIRCVQFMTLVNTPRSIPSSIGTLAQLKVLALANVIGQIPTQLGLVTTLAFLDFDDFSDEPSLPSELGQLSAMSTLRLRESTFPGLPSQLGLLTRLAFLETDKVWFHESNQLPSQIGRLTRLESLLVANGTLFGTLPSQLGCLRNLTALSIADASVEGVLPTELGLLTMLTSIDLRLNSLSGGAVQSLLALPRLVSFVVNQNLLSGPLLCRSCTISTDLQVLVVKDNQLSGTLPSQLAVATALRDLSLESNRQLTGPIPSQVGLLQHLTRLELAQCSFTGSLPSQLALLTNLTTVSIKHNRLHGALPPGLDASLWLADCDRSGIDEPECARDCPDCPFTELKILGCDGRGYGEYCLPFYLLLVGIGALAFIMRVVLRNLVKAQTSRRALVGSSLVSTVAAVHLLLDVLFVANATGGIRYAGGTLLCLVIASRLALVTDEFLFLESRDIVHISDEFKMFALAMLFCAVDPSTVRGMVKAFESEHPSRASQLRRWVRWAYLLHDVPMLCLQITALATSNELVALQAMVGTLVSLVMTARLWVGRRAFWGSALRVAGTARVAESSWAEDAQAQAP